MLTRRRTLASPPTRSPFTAAGESTGLDPLSFFSNSSSFLLPSFFAPGPRSSAASTVGRFFGRRNDKKQSSQQGVYHRWHGKGFLHLLYDRFRCFPPFFQRFDNRIVSFERIQIIDNSSEFATFVTDVNLSNRSYHLSYRLILQVYQTSRKDLETFIADRALLQRVNPINAYDATFDESKSIENSASCASSSWPCATTKGRFLCDLCESSPPSLRYRNSLIDLGNSSRMTTLKCSGVAILQTRDWTTRLLRGEI